MASGTIYGSTSNQYIDAKIEWTSTANASLNFSTVKAALYYKRNNTGFNTFGTGTFAIVVGESATSNTKTIVIESNDWVKAVELITSVDHAADGSKSITLEASGSISGTTLTATWVKGTAVLDTIVRATTLDYLSCSSLYFNGTLTFSYTPKGGSVYNKLNIDIKVGGEYVGVKSLNLGKKSASQQTASLAFTEAELSLIYTKYPNSIDGVMRFTLQTYADNKYSTKIGSPSFKDIHLYIPNIAETQPTATMTVSPVNTLPSTYNSLYIQGHSRVKATLGFSTKYGATVEASNITVNGNTYGSPYESAILSQAGTVSVKATVKDSRGFYGTNYKDIEVIPYSKPYVRAKSGESSIIAARCDQSANFTDSGTYLKIKAKAVFSKVIANGVQKNYGKIKFRYRKEGGAYSSWQTILDCKTDNSDEVITPPLLNGALDISANYQVQIIASDDICDSEPITIAVSSDAVYMDRPAGGKSMGLGGYSSGDNGLDIYWKTKARGGISLYDSKGDEIPLDSTMPLPRDQIKGEWNPDNLECGIHVVANNNALKQGDTVIMYNGVLIQMKGDVGGNVKLQLALPVDTNRNPMYRLCWYSNWSDWRSMKI